MTQTTPPTRRLSLSLSLLSLLMVAPGLAVAQTTPPAEPPPAGDSRVGPFALNSGATPFGAAGQLVISNELQLGLAKTSDGPTVFTIQPAADYFIVPNISVGGLLGLTVTSGDPGATIITFGARAGYNLVLQDRITLWPTAGLTVRRFSSGDFSDTSTYFSIFAPFLFHPVDHLFVGLGPFIDVNMSGEDSSTYGLMSTVGGWL